MARLSRSLRKCVAALIGVTMVFGCSEGDPAEEVARTKHKLVGDFRIPESRPGQVILLEKAVQSLLIVIEADADDLKAAVVILLVILDYVG